MLPYFAACPKGLEYLLVKEIEDLGGVEVRESLAGVRFKADHATAYTICLWSRLASRILLTVHSDEVHSPQDLYDVVYRVNWNAYFDSTKSIAVEFSGTNAFINNTQFGALKAKDAIVDKFRDQGFDRPNVDKQQAAVRIECRMVNNKLSLAINFSGRSLQQRGYRTNAGAAPLRENLAAAVLLRSGWDVSKPLLDPFCGSGTLVIEAALMAANIAPSLTRNAFAFESLKAFKPEVWQEIKASAQAIADESRDRKQLCIRGSDMDSRVLNVARDNAHRAGVEHLVSFEVCDALSIKPPFGNQKGFIVTNPPYGERLGELLPLIFVYHGFAKAVKAKFSGWNLSVFSSSIELLTAIRLAPDHKYKLFNGQLEALLANYNIGDGELKSVSKQAEPFANRLIKNNKTLSKWAKSEGIDAYRLYDADLPDYNLAIDRYGEHWIVQEYAAPKFMDKSKTMRRLIEAFIVLDHVFEIDTDKLKYKVREVKKGENQYEKLNEQRDKFVVNEYNAKFLINTSDYLDNGLFLDHRLTRHKVQKLAQDKDFLNLFCYTGSASVHAALGGAESTTSVDMSKTYLEWAKENFRANGLNGPAHQFIQMDCLTWLAYCQSTYDLIFIDPPTFSNSKRMAQTLDINRDYAQLLQNLKRILREDGLIIFSNNSRQFKMDHQHLAKIGLVAKDISKETIPRDFKGNQKIHNCWEVRHA
ncbi:bifunctional 23S rRNA (guanine(2069)-N(7))-methyltransferase RlmK/23S rRNA (guanine(2445)-N(2))-methyltransferase RlmL [Psychrobium sp. 1_MG-2023]|uniref:bifunctional 23S rRNA (guanine(2069)-N(7))-methyltransferase RlmK/23S rRNA (guanine(2445)-N(2))-methyltransferase RlmL n=1 Tax=Psychrobium sp. 1_MG-2023 TaxID=3062624 RepID=UPI000C34F911|nr:bifunctional 23S rRNA (guanine(2069)-N(7))-methyltransferase RlmK/23S rRNA (guanine(2445)-N(2))-methyltransferase RlmL [Psychrobium sp. 1_MG-2023]MDP2560353.1 bifunctional 23S rRNA (guanine(2069)-N(7))-methyltransferase RlmK/23S rRNA (guanine(2445)-N(2))-methyltransferase RlmL [Psychrobium sp. 1_MG-2023]PKF55462.1 bifunctional 23S rRNA (guanine(2069)-N(7))-methyltransferase RlmK/23S rRNA (guanine(2445)-N(2))-methyltransferase RlmL [Alteromonadales bacterium alter-6D02]